MPHPAARPATVLGGRGALPLLLDDDASEVDDEEDVAWVVGVGGKITTGLGDVDVVVDREEGVSEACIVDDDGVVVSCVDSGVVEAPPDVRREVLGAGELG